MAYTKTEWKAGDLITEGKLNNAENGIAAATQAAEAAASPKVAVTALAAGEAPTATSANGTITFGIPAGAKGKDGTNGTNGTDGLSFRTSSETLVASGTGAFNKVSGGKAVVGDSVLGADGNLWPVTAVAKDTYTVGAAATLKLTLATP